MVEGAYPGRRLGPMAVARPVEITCWRGGAGEALFLLNQAASQAGRNNVVRWVAPALACTLDVAGLRARGVTAVTGRPLRWENRAEGLHVEIDGLDAYEALLVDRG